jgi:HPt (histidine-containing phosphotransfer) domain-containing protein
MPKVDGLSATRTIRDLEKREPSRKRIPIVGITAHAFPEDIPQMLAAGLDDVLIKPVGAPQIQSILAKYFGQTASPASLGETEIKAMPKLLHIDVQDILERSGGRKKIAKRMLESFVMSAPQLLSELQTQFEGQDWAGLSQTAHALKGILLEVGCREGGEHATWLQNNSESKDALEEISKRVQSLQRSTDAALKEASEWSFQ